MRMPIRTVGEYLKRWGFTPQKPYRCAYEQNPKKVKQWLEERYPAVVKRAKHEDAEFTGPTRPGCATAATTEACSIPQAPGLLPP
jgi:hypothetical protein